MSSEVIPIARRIGGFCARHLLAMAVTTAAGCVLWTILYLILLLWALLAGSDIGGPLTYPVGLLFVVVTGMGASLFLLMPATVSARWWARRRGKSMFSQIPLSVAALAGLCALFGGVAWAAGWQPRLIEAAASAGSVFVALLLPLGLYWWTVQSGPLLMSLLKRLRELRKLAVGHRND